MIRVQRSSGPIVQIRNFYLPNGQVKVWGNFSLKLINLSTVNHRKSFWASRNGVWASKSRLELARRPGLKIKLLCTMVIINIISKISRQAASSGKRHLCEQPGIFPRDARWARKKYPSILVNGGRMGSYSSTSQYTFFPNSLNGHKEVFLADYHFQITSKLD